MFGHFRFLTAAVVAAGAGLFTLGCGSSNNAGSTNIGGGGGTKAVAAHEHGEAVTCEKCKVTWVKAPVTNDKGRVIAYTTRKSHECPDCRAAVSNFFATGKLQHSCTTCGADAMQVCEQHVRQ